MHTRDTPRSDDELTLVMVDLPEGSGSRALYNCAEERGFQLSVFSKGDAPSRSAIAEADIAIIGASHYLASEQFSSHSPLATGVVYPANSETILDDDHTNNPPPDSVLFADNSFHQARLFLDRLASIVFEEPEQKDNQQNEDNNQASVLLATIQTIGRIGYWTYDHQTKLSSWSDELYRLHERPKSQGVASIEELQQYYLDSVDSERLNKLLTHAVTHAESGEMEAWLSTPSGTRRRIRHVIRPLNEHTTLGVMMDVTEVRENELAHRLATTLLQSTQELIHIGNWELNMEDDTLRWSDEMYDILQVDRSEPVTFERSVEAWDDQETTRMHGLLERCINQGISYNEVTEFYLPDGQQRYGQATGRAMRNANGEIIRIIGTLRDITEQQREQERQERRKTLLRQTSALSGVGGWYYNRKKDQFKPSPEAREILGLPKDFVSSFDTAISLIHNDGRDDGRELLTECLREGSSFTREVRLNTNDSDHTWAQISGEAHIKDDKIVGIYGAVQNVTERKQRIAEAEWTARILEQTINVSQTGGWRYNPSADETTYTNKFKELLEIDDDDSMSMDENFSYVHPDDREIARQATLDCIANGTPFDITVRVFTRSNKQLWGRITGKAKTVDGTLVEIYGAFQDITKQRQQEERRRQFELQVQHAQKLESLGVLAGGIAHDFNNLLVSIMGYASLARNACDRGSEAHDMLESVVTASQQAAELTKQLLAYSGKGRLVIEDIDLNELVRDMGNILRVALPKGVTLKESYAQNLPIVAADHAQIAQVVMNLITNAGEAMQETSGIVTVSTSLVEADKEYLDSAEWHNDLEPGYYVCLEVADTGAGMNAEVRSKLFEPFFTTKFTGRGLGLAAVLGIVRGHEGAIRVYSEVGKGSTFRVLLPISENAEAKRIPRSDSVSELEGTALVVDDEKSIRNIARMILETSGMSVDTANDGLDAIRKFKEQPNHYQIVLLDMTMPHIGGREAFKKLRAIKPDISIVLSSGYAEQEATTGLEGKRVSGFIQKPYRPQELIEAFKHALAFKNDQ